MHLYSLPNITDTDRARTQDLTLPLLPQDSEVLNAWLTDFHFEEYYQLFINAGYDMPTVSRMTPEVRR